MSRLIRNAGSVGAVLALIVAGGWAAVAQTGGRAAPAAQAMQGVANPPQGFSQNGDQPIKIYASRLEVRDKDHAAIFIGNVHVVQGDSTMTCKTLVVFYDENASANGAPKIGQQSSGNQQIKKLEARGDVVITQNGQTASGDRAVFDMKTNTVFLTGNGVRKIRFDDGVPLDRVGRSLSSPGESSTQ